MEGSAGIGAHRSRLRVAAVVGVSAAVGLGVWVLCVRSTVKGAGCQPLAGATAVTRACLETIAAGLGHPIYWAGPETGTTYELTQTLNGSAYVRYLPGGVRAGASEPYFTVGTYPVDHAFAATTSAAGGPNTVRIPVAGGGIAFYAKRRPTSVYLAFPGVNEQIEVFDPSPALARQAVAAGRIRPVS